MAESTNIHAELHPRHLLDTRMRRERRSIAERYEPSARELFAARELIAEGKAHIAPSAHRAGRMAKRSKRLRDQVEAFASWVDGIREAAERVAGRAA